VVRSVLAPKISCQGLDDDITKATSDWKGLRIAVKLITQNTQVQIEVVPLPLPLKNPQGAIKRQKENRKTSNIAQIITFDKIANTA
jgi:large subunit ribosomal protein L12e